MRFIQYLKVKRYFLALYVLLMLFVSAIMLVNPNQQHVLSNIVYTNVSCGFFTALYLIIGFFYKNAYYRELQSLLERDAELHTASLPEPQNEEQKLHLRLIEQWNNAHNQQLQKLQDEKRDHQEYILSWIHEVKLPIAASRLLIENSMDKTVDFLVDKLEDEIDKIDQNVEQALYYSRIDSFSKDYFIADVSLSSILKASVKKYAKLFINKRIRFTMNEIPLQSVHSDSKWLAFIVDQLMANALKYTGEGGEISVRYEEDNKERRLIIRDTGIGIKSEDIQRVFEKGFTGSNGRLYSKSTGIGLYLAKLLACKLGHDLSIRSVDGEFTEACIHFPRMSNYLHI
ncbi:MAG: sensor histidine kinase [Paenibacillus sp.]|nr:sensor histidine kinase [Paenibacillus sp.]